MSSTGTRGAASTAVGRVERFRRSILSGEFVWASFVLLLGLGTYRVATTMSLQQAHDPLGGRFIPVLIAVGLTIAATGVIGRILLLDVLRDPGTARETSAAATTVAREPLLERPHVRVLAMVAISIVFVGIMDQYRFVPGAIVGMAASMWLLGERRSSRLVVVPIITAAIVFMVFTRLLMVRLP